MLKCFQKRLIFGSNFFNFDSDLRSWPGPTINQLQNGFHKGPRRSFSDCQKGAEAVQHNAMNQLWLLPSYITNAFTCRWKRNRRWTLQCSKQTWILYHAASLVLKQKRPTFTQIKPMMMLYNCFERFVSPYMCAFAVYDMFSMWLLFLK